MATEITQLAIGAADRRDDVVRVELWRTVSAVGNWMAILRNTGGQFNGVFDVQDDFLIDINGFGNTLMEGRVDGPAVTLRGVDLESDWDEYIIIRGVDRAQDLLFHNDFDLAYPDAETAAQQIKTVLGDVINTQLLGLTNTSYTVPVGATPAVGSVEFREGTNFLATIQDMFRRAGWIFYVEDLAVLGLYPIRAGAPGFSASAVILNSVAEGSNNILDIVDLQERGGDKHYNYIKFYGKNPMFDGWTEYNVPSWTAMPAGQILDDNATVRVGDWSQVVYNNNPTNSALRHQLDLPVFNYAVGEWDLSKGVIGAWGLYDNTAGAPGTPGAGGFPANEMAEIRLYDNLGAIASYYGESTRLYIGEWGFMNANLGQKYDNTGGIAGDQWSFVGGPGTFNWQDIRTIWFQINRSNLGGPPYPSHFYIDGITLSLPCVSIVQNAGAQGNYRRRPYVDYLQHINTQNALNEATTQFLDQVESTLINKISLVTEGNLALHYAGQSVTVNIPSMGLNNSVMYMTQIHHVIEPYKDVSGGYGFDWVTEVEAVPVSGVAYDMARLRDGPMYSSTQEISRAGTGLRRK